jgi:hypothetical protein
VLDVGQVMVEVGLGWLLLLLGSAHPHLRSRSLAIVVDGSWSNPHQVAVHLQRPPVLVVDEDANRQALHLFGLEHSPTEALVEIGPDEVRLRIINFNAFGHPALGVLAHVDLQVEQLVYPVLVDCEILCEVYFIGGEQLHEKTIEIVPISDDGQFLLGFIGILRRQESKLDPASPIRLHYLHFSILVEDLIHVLRLLPESAPLDSEKVSGSGKSYIDI